MQVRQLSAEDTAIYDRYVRTHPHGTLWQSSERKAYVEACGKRTRTYVVEENRTVLAGACVVVDKTAGGLSTWELPRGPLWQDDGALKTLLLRIREDAEKERCVELFVSPLVPLPPGTGFSPSRRRVHAEATRMIDLSANEEAILAQMHQKGRYNIGVAAKNGVTVRKGSVHDIDAFYAILQSTGSRDGFTISQKSHYTRFLTDLEGSFVLMADAAGKPIAGLMGVLWNGTGIYYYGASSYEDRKLMAPYALQWEAMRYCKTAGCTRYDLLGISAEQAPADDPWWGITDFKRKFGGEVVTYPPEQSVVFLPIAKKLLGWKRKIFG